jgi:hypothetical protein
VCWVRWGHRRAAHAAHARTCVMRAGRGAVTGRSGAPCEVAVTAAACPCERSCRLGPTAVMLTSSSEKSISEAISATRPSGSSIVGCTCEESEGRENVRLQLCARLAWANRMPPVHSR